MPSYLTTSKASALLTRVQLNPQISTADSAYVTDLVQRAANDLVAACNLPRYPELAAGYTQSGASPSTDLTALATSRLRVSVNGRPYVDVSLDLSACDTGAHTAAELQAKIRAIGSTGGFDEVTVSYANSLYTVTSGRYGEQSRASISFVEQVNHVAQALKLAPEYGAIEVRGSVARAEADDLVVEMVEILYRKMGLEGTQSGSVPGDNSYSMFADELSGSARRRMYGMRRLFL